jgi:hypothetical protein
MKRINKKALYIILFSLFIILIISIYSQMNVYENMTTKTIAPKPKSTIDKNSIQKSTLDVIEGKMTKFFFNFNAFKGRIKEFNEKIKFGKSQFNGTNIIQMLVKYQTGYQYTDGTNYKKDASEYKCINEGIVRLKDALKIINDNKKYLNNNTPNNKRLMVLSERINSIKDNFIYKGSILSITDKNFIIDTSAPKYDLSNLDTIDVNSFCDIFHIPVIPEYNINSKSDLVILINDIISYKDAEVLVYTKR